MRNEEKAKEIATENQEEYAECGSYSLKSYDECYESALEMAEWKDEQHAEEKRQMIDKACEWLEENIHDYYMTCEFEQWFDQMFVDLRKELEKI